MSADQIDDQSTLPALDVDRPIEALLLSVAHGDREAFVALQSRMAGLVRVNVRRILRDASRSEAVTREVFAEALEDTRRDVAHSRPPLVARHRRSRKEAVMGIGIGVGTLILIILVVVFVL